MEVNVDLWCDDNLLDDPEQYRRLIRKLIYLTVIRPNITFAVGILSKFIHQRREVHWMMPLGFLPM